MLRGHKRIEKQNFERRVVFKKGSQEIGFVPRSSFLQPAFGILERPQNIVEMNNNSLFQEWQDLEEQVQHIASGLADVAGVHEQKIIVIERLEQIFFDVLNALCQNFAGIFVASIQ